LTKDELIENHLANYFIAKWACLKTELKNWKEKN
jgi:hypothetical protein